MRETQCMVCKHATFVKGVSFTCAAFPNGVPHELESGQVDHRKPVPGDHGIQYEPSDTALELGIALEPLEPNS
jgi:hypothetical protein